MESKHLEVTSPSDREVVPTRFFDAPRRLVVVAWTTPDYVARWWGLPGSEKCACEIDLRPGGLWHFTQRGADGKECSFRGEYRSVLVPERLVYTFLFDADGWRDREVVATVTFEEHGDKTKFTQAILHKTTEDLDAYLRAGMDSGASWAASFRGSRWLRRIWLSV